MTPAETLAAAAALIREQHGPGCPDHAFWAATADLLDAAHVRAREAGRGGLLDAGQGVRALRVACAYLAAQEVTAL